MCCYLMKARIEQGAADYGMAVFDANQLFEDLTGNGYSSNGFTMTADFLTGGFLSLDGLHLTARGQAAVANEMMKVIDDNYGSNFKEAGALVDVGDYPVFFPAVLP